MTHPITELETAIRETLLNNPASGRNRRLLPAEERALEKTTAALTALCRNRACVNPTHLEPVTNQENAQRGEVGGKANAAKTHCPHGHEYTLENTYINKRGGRICRECKRASYRSWYGTQRSIA